MTTSDKLVSLCKGVRAINPGLEIKISSSETSAEQWCVTVMASSVILIYTGFAPLDDALGLAISKLANISQKTLAAVKKDE